MFGCKGCGVVLPAPEFRIHKRGYRIGKCRGCERRYMRENYAANGDVLRKRKRESMARRRAADPDGARAYQLANYHANRDARLITMKAYQHRRFFWLRATKLRGVNAADLAALWKRQRGLCGLTGRRLNRHNAQLDHIIARARGGSDAIDNIRWVCTEANLAKRELSDAEFAALCSDVMRFIGGRIQMVEAISQANRQAA